MPARLAPTAAFVLHAAHGNLKRCRSHGQRVTRREGLT